MLAKYLYAVGRITREEAMERCEPYLTEANEIAKEIAKRYNKRPTRITFIGFIR